MQASALEQSKSELAAALAAARSGQLSVAEVEQVLRQVEQRVTAAKQESLALVGLKVASKVGVWARSLGCSDVRELDDSVLGCAPWERVQVGLVGSDHMW